MRVEVVYALPQAADSVLVVVPAGATVREAIAASGLLARHSAGQTFGIFGKLVPPQARVVEGDRVEIYRPLALDPKEARRRRAGKRPP